MTTSVFGFKFINNGKHAYIAGHVATKDGNVEFSAAGPCDTAQTLAKVLNDARNSLETIHRWGTCNHRYDDGKGMVSTRCLSCGMEDSHD
jgi:hypothetical protein